MSKDKCHLKRHSHVLNLFLNHGFQGIYELALGIYILFMENMPNIVSFIVIFVNIAYAAITIIRGKMPWEVYDEVIKDNERKCGDYTLRFLFISLLIACIPFLFTTTRINTAASFCFVISYGNFLYFVIYAVIAHRQKKLSSDIYDELPPYEVEFKGAKK